MIIKISGILVNLYVWKDGDGTRRLAPILTNAFSIIIQIPWKFFFAVTPFLGMASLQILTHATAQLFCHVQNL